MGPAAQMPLSTAPAPIEALAIRAYTATTALGRGRQAQADALAALLARIGQPVDAAVQLEVPTELLVERIAGRAKAEGRADDQPEAVRKRLQVYTSQTAPVIDFYRQHGQLTVVDGVGELDVVFTRIIEAISPGHDVG